MINGEFLLSIVTPTYNRGKLLKNCFQSLRRQTDKRFEWIIVDDGSTDNTEMIVTDIKNAASEMSIIYVKKENGGKHTALNVSHEYIHGVYVLILDSDDTLTEKAVEEIHKEWKNYYDISTVGIVTFLKGESADKPNAYAKDERMPVDIMRYKRVCVRSNDCCEVIRTELFKKYPFPQIENERFMSEGILWNRVALTHKCVYINKVIYLCEYLEDGLTKSGRAMRIRNPYGGMLNSEVNMNRKNFISRRIKSGLLYVCYGFFAGLRPFEIIGKEKDYRMLKALCLIPGFGMYCLWKWKYR